MRKTQISIGKKSGKKKKQKLEEGKESHLFSVQRRVKILRKRRASNRKKRVIITRLRIGHSNINRTLLTVGKCPTENNRR